MQKPFVETGRASQLVALADSAGIPLAQEQRDLTAYQRMVLIKEIERQHEDADSPGHGGHGGNIPNAAASGGGQQIKGETVEYVNSNA